MLAERRFTCRWHDLFDKMDKTTMKKTDPKENSGQKGHSGGSYREKQPAAPNPGKKGKEDAVDENGDGKGDYSVHSGTRKTKTSS